MFNTAQTVAGAWASTEVAFWIALAAVRPTAISCRPADLASALTKVAPVSMGCAGGTVHGVRARTVESTARVVARTDKLHAGVGWPPHWITFAQTLPLAFHSSPLRLRGTFNTVLNIRPVTGRSEGMTRSNIHLAVIPSPVRVADATTSTLFSVLNSRSTVLSGWTGTAMAVLTTPATVDRASIAYPVIITDAVSI
jgi:hypothetical protein